MSRTKELAKYGVTVQELPPPPEIHEVGEIFPVALHLGGVAPSNSGAAKYIELTAGKEGAGEYNFGLIDNVIISGSAPLTIVTAEVVLENSPLSGQLVHLLNTEQRFIQPGSAGTVNRHHTAPPVSAFSAASNGSHTHGLSNAQGSGGPYPQSGASSSFGSDGTPRSGVTTSAGAHTHTVSGGDVVTAPKRAEITHFMRIL